MSVRRIVEYYRDRRPKRHLRRNSAVQRADASASDPLGVRRQQTTEKKFKATLREIQDFADVSPATLPAKHRFLHSLQTPLQNTFNFDSPVSSAERLVQPENSPAEQVELFQYPSAYEKSPHRRIVSATLGGPGVTTGGLDLVTPTTRFDDTRMTETTEQSPTKLGESAELSILPRNKVKFADEEYYSLEFNPLGPKQNSVQHSAVETSIKSAHLATIHEIRQHRTKPRKQSARTFGKEAYSELVLDQQQQSVGFAGSELFTFMTPQKPRKDRGRLDILMERKIRAAVLKSPNANAMAKIYA